MGVTRDRGDDSWYDIFENARDFAHLQYRAALEGLGGDPSEVVADP
jgi:hypothetical protein